MNTVIMRITIALLILTVEKRLNSDKIIMDTEKDIRLKAICIHIICNV